MKNTGVTFIVPQWKSQLLPASFMGIPFGIVSTETIVGRRVVVHEYPFNDEPFSQDMGAKARTYNVKAFCIGNDYIPQMIALLNACDSDNSYGTLVLPTLGNVTVICQECRTVFSNTEGGIEYLELKFVTAGQQQFPAGTLNTITGVASAVTNALITFGASFSSSYDTTDLPNFIGNASLYNLIGNPTPLGGNVIQPSQSLVSVLTTIMANGAVQQ